MGFDGEFERSPGSANGSAAGAVHRMISRDSITTTSLEMFKTNERCESSGIVDDENSAESKHSMIPFGKCNPYSNGFTWSSRQICKISLRSPSATWQFLSGAALTR